MTTELPAIHALWIGSSLGAISTSCLNSFVMRGHTVHLHTYSKLVDIPEDIIVCDANDILPEEEIFTHKKSGSYASFADFFRYELLKQVDNIIYVDCDVYCFKPLSIPESKHLFGYEDDTIINNAVLAMPSSSKILESLLDASYDSYFIPPWSSSKNQKKMKFKKALGMSHHVADMPWGTLGPQALTFYADHFNLTSCAQPIDIFYPVHYSCVSHFTDPNLNIEDITSSRTLCLHLYNEMLKKVDISNLNPTCVLSKMLKNEI